MTTDDLHKQIKEATRIVESWPLWKRNILVESSKPTVKVPRIPVDNIYDD